MLVKDGRSLRKSTKRKGKVRKKVKIGWAIYKSGKLTYNPTEAERYTYVGDFEAPIAIGKYIDLYANCDEEFFNIIELWRWHRAGLICLKLEELTKPIAHAIRYLIEDDLARRTI